MSGLIIAIPSKGRLKEQVEGWLADCGLKLDVSGGARGYMAGLKGLPGAQVRLLSASDIADALDAGEVHLGVTGEDLLRERGEDLDGRVLLLRALGFGRADLVTAVPKSWLDVESMADLEEVAHDYLARTGRRMRVATKYLAQTRAFFARHGVADYRIVESGGATEGAPAAGSAELVVDITTTGATLAANGLKVLADGIMLKSQAQLAAGLRAAWDETALAAAERLLRIVEARAAALRSATLAWPARGDAAEAAAVDALTAAGATRRPNGLLVDSAQTPDAALALAAAGLGPVTASKPDFVYDVSCHAFDTLGRRSFDGTVKRRRKVFPGSRNSDPGVPLPVLWPVDSGRKLPFCHLARDMKASSPEVSGVSGRKRPLNQSDCSRRPAAIIPRCGPDLF